MKLFKQTQLKFVAARLGVTLIVAVVSIYALAGIPSASFFRNQSLAKHELPVSESDLLPTPVELLACLSGEGYWAFPGSHWAIGETKVAAGASESFWTTVAEQAASVDTLDPERSFDRLLPLFRESAKQPMVHAGVNIYRVEYGANTLGCVTRLVGGTERVVGGALLVANDAGPWNAFQLKGNPLLTSAPRRFSTQLSQEPGGRLVATRYDVDGTVVAEFVAFDRTENVGRVTIADARPASGTKTPSTRSAVARFSKDSQDYFIWTTRRDAGELQLIVTADTWSKSAATWQDIQTERNSW